MLRATGILLYLAASLMQIPVAKAEESDPLCLDGFCIGQSIAAARFGEVRWLIPNQNVSVETCSSTGCQPSTAFRGYAPQDQLELADAVRLIYAGTYRFTIVTPENLNTLRRYHYDCNQSAGGLSGERRFLAAYLSKPSGHLTVIGLRLIAGELRIYRIARKFPIHNRGELQQLATNLSIEYGPRISYVNYLSSNAPFEVIQKGTDGWFGRSQMFNPSDMADNAAELVLIDPQTRALLEPTSMPDSGEIKPMAARLPEQCTSTPSVQ